MFFLTYRNILSRMLHHKCSQVFRTTGIVCSTRYSPMLGESKVANILHIIRHIAFVGGELLEIKRSSYSHDVCQT